MTEKTLIGWTILAGLANVAVGVYVATESLYGGVLVISNSLMLLGLGVALVWESRSRSASSRVQEDLESSESSAMPSDDVNELADKQAA